MNTEMEYVTSLHPDALHCLKKMGSADLLVGIPCLNNENTVANVMDQASPGLADHFGDRDSVIFVSDGGSTDDTREIAQSQEIEPRQEKIVSLFRGPRGKGSAVRQVSEASELLDVGTVNPPCPFHHTIRPDRSAAGRKR